MRHGGYTILVTDFPSADSDLSAIELTGESSSARCGLAPSARCGIDTIVSANASSSRLIAVVLLGSIARAPPLTRPYFAKTSSTSDADNGVPPSAHARANCALVMTTAGRRLAAALLSSSGSSFRSRLRGTSMGESHVPSRIRGPGRPPRGWYTRLLGGSDGTNFLRSSSGSGSLVSSSMAWYFGSGNDAFFKPTGRPLASTGRPFTVFPRVKVAL